MLTSCWGANLYLIGGYCDFATKYRENLPNGKGPPFLGVLLLDPV